MQQFCFRNCCILCSNNNNRDLGESPISAHFSTVCVNPPCSGNNIHFSAVVLNYFPLRPLLETEMCSFFFSCTNHSKFLPSSDWGLVIYALQQRYTYVNMRAIFHGKPLTNHSPLFFCSPEAAPMAGI